jgi:hypothetical protein
MAAAGMVVVTNLYSNRAADDLIAYSSNIIGVELRIDRLAHGLAEAARRCANIAERLAGARDVASENWSEVYPRHLGALTTALAAGEWPSVQDPLP